MSGHFPTTIHNDVTGDELYIEGSYGTVGIEAWAEGHNTLLVFRPAEARQIAADLLTAAATIETG